MIRRMLAPPHPARVYLLRDEFITAQSAPLTSPRNGEPGPGQLKISDPSNQISIASGKIQASGGDALGTTFVSGNTSVAYAAGLALLIVAAKYNGSGYDHVGWLSNNTTAGGTTWRGQMESGDVYRDIAAGNSVNLSPGTGVGTTAQDYAFVRNADAGQWVFVSGALVWVDDSASNAALYPMVLHAHQAASTPEADAVRVTNLSGAWTVSEGIASLNAANPSSGASYTATADALHEISFTLPGSPANGDKIELRYRVADSSNYWTAYVKYNGSAWDFFLDSVSGGTPTNRITVSSVGSTDKIRVLTNGTKHDCWTRASGAWTKRGGQTNVSFQDTQTAINTTFSAGTVTAIKSYPRSGGLYNDLGGI